MRILLSLLAYAGTLVLTAGVSFVVVIVLAGPHAGLLPHWLEVVVFCIGWAAIFVVPVLAAWKVWRRVGASTQSLDR